MNPPFRARLLRFVDRAVRKLALADALAFTVTKRVDGRAFRIPLADGLGWHLLETLDVREAWLDRMLATGLGARRGAFVDVGANQGQTLLKVMAVDPRREYLGFEPHASCQAYLKRLIAANEFANCRVVPIGLSDKPLLARLFMQFEGDLTASVVDGFRAPSYYKGETFVPVLDGDRVLESIGLADIAMLKIDVEGAEYDVVRGLLQTIRKFRPPILCEVLPVSETASPQGQLRKTRQDALVELLHGEDYHFGRIDAEGSVRKLEVIEVHADLSQCEYLFWPRESDTFAAHFQTS